MNKMTPNALLALASSQVIEKATDQASTLAGQFVSNRIENGSISSNTEAVNAFKALHAELKPFLEGELMKVAVAMIEANLPHEEVKA
jgi:hypothetical protein